jgi:hypothetical protein
MSELEKDRDWRYKKPYFPLQLSVDWFLYFRRILCARGGNLNFASRNFGRNKIFYLHFSYVLITQGKF